MSYFLFKRILTLLATLAATSVIVFAVLEVLPGNAAQVLMGPDADPAAVAAKVVELGLDRPPLARYVDWMRGLLRGDMGNSYAYGSPVAELIAERLLLTVPLAVLAMTLTATAGRLLTLEEVQTAFVERSKSLVTADFVAAYNLAWLPRLLAA